MKKEIITSGAPGAIGPYSQAIEAGGLVFVSGQLPADPATGQLAEGIAAQTERSLLNLKAILEEAGLSLKDAGKVTVYLKDMNDFSAMNEVYQRIIPSPYPARVAVEVARLPKDALVEIELIAAR